MPIFIEIYAKIVVSLYCEKKPWDSRLINKIVLYFKIIISKKAHKVYGYTCLANLQQTIHS